MGLMRQDGYESLGYFIHKYKSASLDRMDMNHSDI